MSNFLQISSRFCTPPMFVVTNGGCVLYAPVNMGLCSKIDDDIRLCAGYCFGERGEIPDITMDKLVPGKGGKTCAGFRIYGIGQSIEVDDSGIRGSRGRGSE